MASRVQTTVAAANQGFPSTNSLARKTCHELMSKLTSTTDPKNLEKVTINFHITGAADISWYNSNAILQWINTLLIVQTGQDIGIYSETKIILNFINSHAYGCYEFDIYSIWNTT